MQQLTLLNKTRDAEPRQTCDAVHPLRKQNLYRVICEIFCIGEHPTHPDTDAATEGGLMLYLTLVLTHFCSHPRITDAKNKHYFLSFRLLEVELTSIC